MGRKSKSFEVRRDLAEKFQEDVLFIGAEDIQELRHELEMSAFDEVIEFSTGIGQCDFYDPAILRLATTQDEFLVLKFIDHGRHAAQRELKPVSDFAHGHMTSRTDAKEDMRFLDIHDRAGSRIPFIHAMEFFLNRAQIAGEFLRFSGYAHYFDICTIQFCKLWPVSGLPHSGK